MFRLLFNDWEGHSKWFTSFFILIEAFNDPSCSMDLTIVIQEETTTSNRVEMFPPWWVRKNCGNACELVQASNIPGITPIQLSLEGFVQKQSCYAVAFIYHHSRFNIKQDLIKLDFQLEFKRIHKNMQSNAIFRNSKL